jgi:hypothetical protein
VAPELFFTLVWNLQSMVYDGIECTTRILQCEPDDALRNSLHTSISMSFSETLIRPAGAFYELKTMPGTAVKPGGLQLSLTVRWRGRTPRNGSSHSGVVARPSAGDFIGDACGGAARLGRCAARAIRT